MKLKLLESITGLLNFAGRVISAVRAFIRHLYNLMTAFCRRLPLFKIGLTMGVKLNLQMWERFLDQYNRVTMFLPEEPHIQQALGIQVATDTDGWV